MREKSKSNSKHSKSNTEAQSSAVSLDHKSLHRANTSSDCRFMPLRGRSVEEMLPLPGDDKTSKLDTWHDSNDSGFMLMSTTSLPSKFWPPLLISTVKPGTACCNLNANCLTPSCHDADSAKPKASVIIFVPPSPHGQLPSPTTNTTSAARQMTLPALCALRALWRRPWRDPSAHPPVAPVAQAQ